MVVVLVGLVVSGCEAKRTEAEEFCSHCVVTRCDSPSVGSCASDGLDDAGLLPDGGTDQCAFRCERSCDPLRPSAPSCTGPGMPTCGVTGHLGCYAPVPPG